MTRAELEHAIRAACDVSGDDEVYVFGSQAILGQYPEAPESLRQSAEADIAPVKAVDMSTLLMPTLESCRLFIMHLDSMSMVCQSRPPFCLLVGKSGQLPSATTTRETVRAGASRLMISQ